MPQLDKVMFSTQVFWVLLFIFFLYFYIGYNVLPRVKGIFYARKEQIVDNQKYIIFLDLEYKYILRQLLSTWNVLANLFSSYFERTYSFLSFFALKHFKTRDAAMKFIPIISFTSVRYVTVVHYLDNIDGLINFSQNGYEYLSSKLKSSCTNNLYRFPDYRFEFSVELIRLIRKQQRCYPFGFRTCSNGFNGAWFYLYAFTNVKIYSLLFFFVRSIFIYNIENENGADNDNVKYIARREWFVRGKLYLPELQFVKNEFAFENVNVVFKDLSLINV
jgi:uncharacterized membrane protein